MIPKFKIWDKDNLKMYKVKEVDEINFETEQVGVFDLETKICRNIKFEDAEFLQLTGLKDKNGVEIFEGDILEVSYDDIHGEFCGCDVVAKNPFDYSLTEANWLNHAYEIEIIGNAYEHGHLLKGDE